jgi:hypothetical protein
MCCFVLHIFYLSYRGLAHSFLGFLPQAIRRQPLLDFVNRFTHLSPGLGDLRLKLCRIVAGSSGVCSTPDEAVVY